MMKKIFPVFLAVVFGCFCAYTLFQNVEEKSMYKRNGNAVAVQLGVFKEEEPAKKLVESVGGRVFKDDDLYRVYYSILGIDENIDFITDTLDQEGIAYYLKSLSVPKSELNETLKYEEAMKDMKKEERLSLNSKILNIYERSDMFVDVT